MNVTVELKIFSGRPNPTWDLSAAEAESMARMLDSLPEIHQQKQEETLGYHGFTLFIKPENGKPARIHVFQHIIYSEDTRESHRDVHGLERWLLKQASGKGYGALTDSL